MSITLDPAPAADGLAAQFNRECSCLTLDRARSTMRYAPPPATPISPPSSQRDRISISNPPVFLPKCDEAAMQAIATALEAAAGLPQTEA